MIDKDLRSGNTCVFEHYKFDYLQSTAVTAVEQLGDEEGTGSWALKKLVIRQDRSFVRNTIGDEIDWNEPLVELVSFNRQISPLQLDPAGRYRALGKFIRKIESDIVDIDELPEHLIKNIRSDSDPSS